LPGVARTLDQFDGIRHTNLSYESARLSNDEIPLTRL
jgi:hypothetical protein